MYSCAQYSYSHVRSTIRVVKSNSRYTDHTLIIIGVSTPGLYDMHLVKSGHGGGGGLFFAPSYLRSY